MDKFFAWLSVVTLLMGIVAVVLTFIDMAYYYLWWRPHFKAHISRTEKSLKDILKMVESLPVIQNEDE